MTEIESEIRESVLRHARNYYEEDVTFLLQEIDSLRQSVNDWKSVVKIIREDRDQAHLEIANGDEERNSLKSQLSKALDALTITQEEWFLKVQYLERQLYDLRNGK